MTQISNETQAPSRPPGAGVDWRRAAFWIVLLILVYQVAVPFGMILLTSVKTSQPGDPGFMSLEFSLDNYIRIFAGADFWSAVWDTFRFAFASTAISLVVGAFVAWAVERTNMPFREMIGRLLVSRIVVPGILIVISWILIASPNIGVVNQLLLRWTGVRNLLNIYSFSGMVWVNGLELIPLTYLLLSASFQAMDPRLEEASAMTGANAWRTLRRIALPLALPSVAAAILLLFVTSIETFETPLILGGRAHVRVLSTEIYFDTSRTPLDWGGAAAYSVALVALAVGLLLIYFRLIRKGEKYQTITGKDFRPRRLDLGPWRFALCGLCALLVFLITGVPLITMIYVSLLPFYAAPSLAAFKSMSLANYAALFSDSASLGPIANSTILGIVVGVLVTAFVSLIAYLVHKTQMRGRKLLDFLGFAPVAIPGVVLGATFFWFYLLVPLPLIGTLTIIGLAYVTKFMPFALRFVSASMMRIHSELEEAAQVAGVPGFRNFRRIILPLLKPGLLAAFFWVMVHAYRELAVALMLARSNNRTAAVFIYDIWANGTFARLSAFGVVMFAILIALVSIAHSIGRRYGIKEQI
jgi:iron(III) transport system permease protein